MADIDRNDLTALLAMLHRQARLIGVTLGIVLALAALYLFVQTPLYRSSTLVMVDTSYKNLLTTAEPQLPNGMAENARVESEVSILHSDKVLLTTIERAGLMQDAEFGPQLGLIAKVQAALGVVSEPNDDARKLTAETLQRLREAVRIKRSGLTYLIEVSVSSASAGKAAELANTLTQTYIELQVASKQATVLGASTVLQSQLAAARSALASSEQRLDSYIRTNIQKISQETGNAALLSLSDRVIALEGQRLSREGIGHEADAALARDDWQTLADTLGAQAIRALQEQRTALTARLTTPQTTQPEAEALRQQLADLERQLQEVGTAAVGELRSEVAALTNDANQMRRELRTTVLGSDLAPATLTSIYEFQQESDIAQRHYTTLLSRLRDLEAQSALQIADSRIVSNAIPAAQAYAPNTKLVLALAVLIGLGGGVGLALLNEYHIGGVVSASQLANLLQGAQTLAVPRLAARAERLSVADAVIDAPFSAYAEAFRNLRAALDQAAPDRQAPRVIMVTSAAPSEGKSSIALSLARTYAQAGKRTLLIDADLRKPALSKHLDVTLTQGLLDYLSAPGPVTDEFYITDPKSKLGIILGSGRPSTPTDQIIQSRAFETLIRRLRNALDVIIIDTSPILPVVDARYIAPLVDEVVMAVRYASTTQADVRETYRRLQSAVQADTPVLAVLSIDEEAPLKYGYNAYYSDTVEG